MALTASHLWNLEDETDGIEDLIGMWIDIIGFSARRLMYNGNPLSNTLAGIR